MYLLAERHCPKTTAPALCYNKACEAAPCRESRVRNIRHEATFNREESNKEGTPIYQFRVKNNPVRAARFGQLCAITARSPRGSRSRRAVGHKDFNTCAVVFLADGFEMVTSRNFLRRVRKSRGPA